MKRYLAQLIEMGRVINEQEFSALNDESAYREANEGLAPLIGRWVSVQIIPDDKIIETNE